MANKDKDKRATPHGLVRNKDVEFSIEQADANDLEALERAEAAESRVKRGAGH